MRALSSIAEFSDEIAEFIGQPNGKFIDLAYHMMTYAHTKKLYKKETMTIVPDEQLARFVGSREICYKVFLWKLCHHIKRV